MHNSCAALLDALPKPAILAGRDGTVVHANPAATAILADASGLTAADRRLGASDRTSQCQLRRAMTFGLPARLLLPRPPAAPLALSVEPVSASMVLILVTDPQLPPLPAPETLQLVFGLTLAEARVALGILAEGTVPGLAARLGIAPSTVRTHLNRVLSKTGARRQADLARILTAIAAWAPAAQPEDGAACPAA